MTNQTKKAGSNPRQVRRIARYGKLVRGWDWRTTPELLEKANEFIKQKELTKTELIELALRKYIEGK